jgi:predicted ribosome quality control (RQC) complex YloA/Tae2 family protein
MLLIDNGRKIIAVLRPVPPGDRIERPLVAGIVYEPPAIRPPASRKTAPGTPERAGVPGPLPSLAQNRAVEAMFERFIAEREQTRLRQSLLQAVRKAATRTERRIQAVQEDLEAAQRGDEHRRSGELILANLSLLERGQERVDLPDQEGAFHPVTLDPSRTPTENADRYFRRYKKAKAGLAVLRERLEETRAEKGFLAEVRRDVDAAADRESLEKVRNALVRRGLLREAQGRAVRAARAAPPYRTVSYEGWEILIGRSAAGNDYVTMHLARPDDLWLHAEGMPGSHVLVMNPRKRDIPPAVVRKAASLAAWYSKGKGSARVPVAYTAAKYVKKPKGAAPGTVLLRQRKTVMATPEPDDSRPANVP